MKSEFKTASIGSRLPRLVNILLFPFLEKKFPGDTPSSEMINSIRKFLPSLEQLNGETLPKNIQFEEKCQSLNLLLPAKIKLMSVDESAQGVLLNFLQQYYGVYDQNDRGALIVSVFPFPVRKFLKSPGQKKLVKLKKSISRKIFF